MGREKEETMIPNGNGYWVICVQSYEVDGVEISKGKMSYHTSVRPIISNKWRRATQEEIETREYGKRGAYNLGIKKGGNND